MLLSLCINAQTRMVSGIVKDAAGMPVVGAVVMIEGQESKGAVTDENGKYSIPVPAEGCKLVAQCLSYKTAQVKVSTKQMNIDFILEDDSELLEEVVVVGYGAMRRSDLTGAVASIKIDEDDAARSTSLDQMMMGKASGVQILSNNASPDAGVSIRIRGLNTFEGGNEPLYVVDGILINGASSSVNQMADGGTENSHNEEVNGLMGINPQDIASIEILKDASSTAIYGSQGANGVVLITTKMARKERPVIRFSAGMDISQVSNSIPMLSFDEYCDYLVARGISISDFFEDPIARTGCKVEPINWQDYTLRTAYSQRYYFSISGRPKSTSYMFSVGYNDKQGIVKKSGVRQLTSRINLEHSISKKLKVGIKTGFSNVSSNLTSGANAKVSGAAASLMRSMLIYRPYFYEETTDEDVVDPEEEELASGPNVWLEHYVNTRQEIRVTPSVYIDWNIIPCLSFKSTFGGDYRSSETSKFKPNKISMQVGSFASVAQYDQWMYNWDNLLTFNKKLARDHNLTATLGVSMSASSKNTNLSEAWRIEQDRAGLASMNSGTAPYAKTTYNVDMYSLLSFFARAIYNYKNRYVLTATYRLDGSSRFAASNKWASFPSFAFAWRMNEEKWFKVRWISLAKARLGWGQVGNQAIPSYRTLINYGSGHIPDHTVGNSSMTQIAIYNSNLANKNLKWETTEQVNAGIDLGLWKGRLTFTADLYNKNTKDLLQLKNISGSTGFTTMYVNQGSVLNQGLELSFEAVPVLSKDFEWSVGGNISFNRNRITSIGSGIERAEIYLTPSQSQQCNFFWGDLVRSSASTLAVVNIFIEGQPMGLFYGFKTNGIVQEGEDAPGIAASGGKAKAGDVRYLDINRNGTIDDDDRTIIGDPNADFTYAFNTSFKWKNLYLNIGFNGSYGNDIYNANNYTEFNTSKSGTRPYNIRREAFIYAWTSDNTDTIYPRLGYTDEFISDRYIEDGSYLRLANVALSYKFSFKNKKSALRGMDIGVSAGNLYVWTKYSEWDPDVNSFGSNIKRMGIDMGSYPSARTFSADIKFTF